MGNGPPVSIPCPMGQSVAGMDWFRFCTEIAHMAIAIKRIARMNLIYPVSTEVLAIARLG